MLIRERRQNTLQQSTKHRITGSTLARHLSDNSKRPYTEYIKKKHIVTRVCNMDILKRVPSNLFDCIMKLITLERIVLFEVN